MELIAFLGKCISIVIVSFIYFMGWWITIDFFKNPITYDDSAEVVSVIWLIIHGIVLLIFLCWCWTV